MSGSSLRSNRLDDLSLIKAAQAGDASAFEQLLGDYYELIFRFAYRWCGNRSDAEDITQDACLKLARNIQLFRFESAFSSWLYRLVINCAKDWLKSQGRHAHANWDDYTSAIADAEDAAHSDSLGADTGTPAHCDQAAEISIYLRQVLAQLETMATGFKETALLVHGEGLSHAEAAIILEVKESTVSWRLHEIRKHLQIHASAGGGHP